MGLCDYHFETDYNKAYDNIADSFYLPCMRNSVRYDRISGYFGSTIYIIAWKALKDFVSNGGKMRIICSPCISEDDMKALQEGYSSKSSSILMKSIKQEIDDLFSLDYLQSPSRVLACLVAEGIIDLKIAVPSTNNDPDIKRLFHDKVGTFTDSEGNSVGFRGPMNETYKGLSSDGNLESIDVFPSWEGDRDKSRLDRAQDYFNALWAKNVDGIIVYDFPEAARTTLIERSRGSNWRELIDEITVKITKAERWKADKSPGAKSPRQHQVAALETWVAHNRRGIFEHATGSGKTYTAICAIRDALDRQESVVIFVPSTDLLNQWKKELNDNLVGIDVNYLLCGDNNNYWRKQNVLYSWTQYNPNSKRIVITTMDTGVNDQFQKGLAQGEHLFLVADEVHRLGSQKRRSVFEINSGARLGLSATPVRYGDPEGTAAIMDYFGGIIPPPFTLSDAIKSGVLTPYFYMPLPISLTDSEQDEWDQLTKEINVMIARYANTTAGISGAVKNPRVQMKLIARARIIKEASAKTMLALNTIKTYYKKGQKWIIYCDNRNQLKQVLSLLLNNGYDAYEYHSEMEGDRQQTLMYFSLNGGILVSIKCLDEGVDIPSTTHALILASSKNPREFIQRRGRILRRSEGKNFAYLFDAVVIPRKAHDEADKSTSIIEAELARAVQFGEGAKNPSCIAELKIIAVDFGIDINKVSSGGYEEDDKD